MSEPATPGDLERQSMPAEDPGLGGNPDAPTIPDGNPAKKRSPLNAARVRGIAVLSLTASGVTVGIIAAASSSHATPNVAANTAAGAAASRTVLPGPPAPTPGNGASVPGPMPGAPSTPALPARTASAVSASRIKPTNPAQVQSWNAGQAGKVMAQVTNLAGTVLMAYGSGEYPEMLQACRALGGAVHSASALPPIPDAAMRSEYQKSLQALQAGTSACEAGITQHAEGVEDTVTQVNKADVQQAVDQFGTAMTELYAATDYLRKQ